MSKKTTAYLGLGSNLGDKAANIQSALEMLKKNVRISLERTSRTVKTMPLGGKNQNDYLNAVAKIKTDLIPHVLLETTKQIERSIGRQPATEKWDNREIDIDILFFGDEIINTESLTVPHPQLHLRSFVLDGLCELEPGLMHPILKDTVSVLAERLGGGDFFFDPEKPQLICIAGVIGAGKTTLSQAIAERLKCETIKEEYSVNPFLADVYAGNNALALDSQLFFLISRVEQLNPANLGAGRVVVSDYIIDKEKIYASAWLNNDQLKLYNKINAQMCKSVAVPAVVVYLKLDPAKCLERIHSRNRLYEQQIGLEFLETLHAGYENIFSNWTASPLLRVDASAHDFSQTDQADEFVKKIKAYIFGA